MTIHDHPLRDSLSAEMHVRRLPRMAAPCRMMQVVIVLGESGGDEARAHIEALKREKKT